MPAAVTDAAGAPLPISLKASGSSVAEVSLRLLRRVARRAADQRLRPQRRSSRVRPLANQAQWSPHRVSQGRRQYPPPGKKSRQQKLHLKEQRRGRTLTLAQEGGSGGQDGGRKRATEDGGGRWTGFWFWWAVGGGGWRWAEGGRMCGSNLWGVRSADVANDGRDRRDPLPHVRC